MSIRRYIENGVETFETEIEGEKIQWDRSLTYAKHLQTSQLLASQLPVSDKHDEMLFIIIHQSMELWIKLLLHELNEVILRLNQDDLSHAGRTLDRVVTIQRHMIHSWEILATLSPTEFLTFRGFLRKGSGFQSLQYRQLEFMLGNKRAELIRIHNDDDGAAERLTEALNTPSLYDVVLQLLARRGLPVPKTYLERDWAQPYVPCDEIEQVWLTVYTNQEYWDIYSLAEKITAVEYYFQEWRFKHMKTVSRVIGHKQGTGGSSGVNYLIKALDLRFFPELWSMRTYMTAPREGGDYAPAQCPLGHGK